MPPFRFIGICKNITDKHKLYSKAIDIFEDYDMKYLVNEMQCIFGQSDAYQMLVDGKPGRYLFQTEKWIFEEGMFNTNQCFDLRVEWVIPYLLNNTNIDD